MQLTVYDEQIVQLQPRGVFTLPKNMRSGLFDNDRLARIKRVGSRIIIEPIRTLSYPVRSYTNDEINEFLNFDAEETKQLKTKGLI